MQNAIPNKNQIDQKLKTMKSLLKHPKQKLEETTKWVTSNLDIGVPI